MFIQIAKEVISTCLGDDQCFYSQDDVIQFLHVNRHSMESIEIRCPYIVEDEECHWKLVNGHVVPANGVRRGVPPTTTLQPENDPIQTKTLFARLFNIDFTGLDQSRSSRFILWILSNAPNLKTIRLTHSQILPEVADALNELKLLSKLEVAEITLTDDDFYDPLISVMEHHKELEERSTLEELTLHIDGVLSAVDWLNLIPQMKRLMNLKLLAWYISDFCLPALSQINQGCPSLETMTLGITASYLPAGIIQSLSHPKLKSLRIGAKSLSAIDAFALSAFPTLERLYLQDEIPDLIKDTLRKHIPKVIFE